MRKFLKIFKPHSVFGVFTLKFSEILLIILCSVDHASRYIRVKKNELDAHLILSIFRQPLHVSGVSVVLVGQSNQDNRQSSKKNNKYKLFYIYGCIQQEEDSIY